MADGLLGTLIVCSIIVVILSGLGIWKIVEFFI